MAQGAMRIVSDYFASHALSFLFASSFKLNKQLLARYLPKEFCQKNYVVVDLWWVFMQWCFCAALHHTIWCLWQGQGKQSIVIFHHLKLLISKELAIYRFEISFHQLVSELGVVGHIAMPKGLYGNSACHSSEQRVAVLQNNSPQKTVNFSYTIRSIEKR